MQSIVGSVHFAVSSQSFFLSFSLSKCATRNWLELIIYLYARYTCPSFAIDGRVSRDSRAPAPDMIRGLHTSCSVYALHLLLWLHCYYYFYYCCCCK